MSFLETVERARGFLERHRRVSLRALRREFDLDPETLAELSDELVQVQHVAGLEGDVLVWTGEAPPTAPTVGFRSPERDPRAYTPKHLADKILQSRLAEHLGVGNQIVAAHVLCDALACDREWQPLLDAARDALRLIRERGAMRLWEPSFLAHIATAELELGNLDAGRAAAAEGVVFMRTSEGAWNPHSYAVLARAQLALHEPAADIARTLDEYAALLERTEFHLFEGELHELRARLADREGHETEKAAALQRARDCYTRFA